MDKTASVILARIGGASETAKVALRGLHLAAASRHRMWFAVASSEEKVAVGRTPGAASELALAVKAVQRKDPLHDIYVDSEAASLAGAIALVQK